MATMMDVVMALAEGEITRERADYLLSQPPSWLSRRKTLTDRKAACAATGKVTGKTAGKANGAQNGKAGGRKDSLVELLTELAEIRAAGPLSAEQAARLADLEARLAVAEDLAARKLARKARSKPRTESRPPREFDAGGQVVSFTDPTTGKRREGLLVKRQSPPRDVCMGYAAEHTYDHDDADAVADLLADCGVEVWKAAEPRKPHTRPTQAPIAAFSRSEGEITPPTGPLAVQHCPPGTLWTVADGFDHSFDGMMDLYREREDTRWLSAAARLG